LYEADANVGYRLRPFLRTTYHYPQASKESIPIVSNSDGFRSNREFDEPDHRLKIMVVGDSFAFGEGVRQEDRFTDQLERLEPQWRVDNMGMTGWGIDLMVRAIEQFGRKASPDVVVLAVYTDDLRRLLPNYAGKGFGYSKFELRDGELITVPFPYPRSWQRLRLVQFLYQTAWNAKRNRYRNRYELNEALLDRYLKNSKTMGFKPAVVFFPGTNDTKEDQDRRGFLSDWARRQDVAYLDLTSAIHKPGNQNIFINNNSHWNPAGHRLAAEQLRSMLHRVLDTPISGRGRNERIKRRSRNG
jgi:hypothetical protein